MKVNINDKVFKIVSTHPEIKDILASLGFTEILKPGRLETVGRFVSLKNGAKMREIDLNLIINELKMKGYEVVDE